MTKKTQLYTDLSIPARIFFEVFSTGDLSLLGNGTEEQRNKAFLSIFDKYVLADETSKIVESYRKQGKIQILTLQIELISAIIFSLANENMDKQQMLFKIDVLNKIQGANVKFNINKPITQEIKRVQTRVVDYLKTELEIQKLGDKKIKEGVIQTFADEKASIVIATGVYLHDDISLAEYIAFKKKAILIHKSNKTL